MIAETQIENQKVSIGDIFVNTWGYDQTNVDFYKVVGMTNKSIKIRELNKRTTETGFMCGHSVPLSGFNSDKIITKRLKWYEKKVYINMEFGWCELWDGTPKGCSWSA